MNKILSILNKHHHLLTQSQLDRGKDIAHEIKVGVDRVSGGVHIKDGTW